VTEGAKEQDRAAGGINLAAWLAWALAALCVAMFIAVVVLGVLARSARAPGNSTTLGTISETASFVLFLAFPIIGALIASRGPQNPIGWICLADGLLWMILAVIDGYSVYGVTKPGSVPFPVAVGNLPFPKKIRDELIAEGRASVHPPLPDSGWVRRRMDGPDDAEAVIELFRMNYERAQARANRRAASESTGR